MPQRAPDGPLLEITGLSFCYKHEEYILRNVHLEVSSGEYVGVVGSNGAGKTTLFMLLAGVLKPTAGEVRFGGKTILPGKFYPEIGMVFQNPDDQLFCPSVREDVAFGPRNMKLSREEIEARAQEALAVTGIRQLTDHPPHHLSGGQKRLAALAGVLAMRPRLMIYDEPTSNLDMRYRRRVINFLKKLPHEAALVASHDLELILEVCNRVILLNEGIILADGNPREILGDAALMERSGLEKPYSLA